MKAINGVKVFEVGECDNFYPPTMAEAIEKSQALIGYMIKSNTL